MTSKVRQMETHFNFTAITTSGYRCPRGNRSIPDAAEGSRHMDGRAYDFVVAGTRWTEQLKQDIVVWAYANGARLAYYEGWVHVDW